MLAEVKPCFKDPRFTEEKEKYDEAKKKKKDLQFLNHSHLNGQENLLSHSVLLRDGCKADARR